MSGLRDFFRRGGLNQAAGPQPAGPAPYQGGLGLPPTPMDNFNAQPYTQRPYEAALAQSNNQFMGQQKVPMWNNILDRGQQAYGLLQQNARQQEMPQAPPMQMAPSAGIGPTPQGAQYPLLQQLGQSGPPRQLGPLGQQRGYPRGLLS